MDSYSNSLKSIIRGGAARMYHLSNLHRLRHIGKALLLTYHRVLSQEEMHRQNVQPGMYVLDYVFEHHMQFLQEQFEVLSCRDLLKLWKDKAWDHKKRYCVVTFDDGWLDNYVYAYPILRRYGVPATIFLPTDYVGTSEWFWPEKISYLLERSRDSTTTSTKRTEFLFLIEQCLGLGKRAGSRSPKTKTDRRTESLDEIIEGCKELSFEAIYELIDRLSVVLEMKLPQQRLIMNWGEVMQMSQNGISFGSHSCSHRILTKLPLPEVRTELEASHQTLRAKDINYVPVFCYPNGNCNEDIQDLVRECGYEAAVGVRCGVEGESPKDLYEISRFSIHNDIAHSIPLLSFRLLGPLL